MSKIKLKDISLYYEIHGKGEPIVFISGFGVDHLMWQLIIDKFKDKYQVVLFDNRGSGQSDVPNGPYSIEIMANDVASLLVEIGIKKAHFVGNSMGGCILQMLAYKHSQLVKSAILSNTTSHSSNSFYFYLAAQLELLKLGVPLATLLKASASWIFSYKFLSQPGVLENFIKQGLANPYPFSVKGYEAQYAALKHFDSREWLKNITASTLVLASDEDLIFSEKSVQKLVESISHAHYYCFSECGHLPMIEYPEKFFKVIDEFIS